MTRAVLWMLLVGCGDGVEPSDDSGASGGGKDISAEVEAVEVGRYVVDCGGAFPVDLYVPADSVWQVVWLIGDARISATDGMYIRDDTLTVNACPTDHDALEVRWVALF